MKRLGKRKNNNALKVEPRSLLPSSTDVMRGSALGFKNHGHETIALIEQLAELIVEAYIHDKNNTKQP